MKQFTFIRAGFDVFDPRDYLPADGTIVQKTQPFGCPRNGTFGQCYIADLSGRFIGMVDLRSLSPAPDVLSDCSLQIQNWENEGGACRAAE